jgi:hypothetical protein
MIVQISRALADGAELDAMLRRRLRSTTAHECAHIALHGHLHAVPATGALFPDMRPVESRTLCRTETIEQPGRVQLGEWWEYQANRGMASLLLPRAMVREHIAATLARLGAADMLAAIRAGQGEVVIRAIMDAFDVSYEMAFYRLDALGVLPAPGQPELRLR